MNTATNKCFTSIMNLVIYFQLLLLIINKRQQLRKYQKILGCLNLPTFRKYISIRKKSDQDNQTFRQVLYGQACK